MNFLPKNYEAPVSEGDYFKFKKGKNTFRILSPAIVGFEYWTREKKPVRATEAWEEVPEDAKVNEKGGFQKHFWAFIVWNYEAKKVQIMEITQRTIQDAITAYVENPKWGDPTKYDLVVEAKGDGLEREYTTIAEPHSEGPGADISHINLEALFYSEDPFKSKSKVSQEKHDDPLKVCPSAMKLSNSYEKQGSDKEGSTGKYGKCRA
jgi:hypothetical protein